MHIANSDKPVGFYSLDVAISAGYRVNSKRGTQFRIWATEVLRDLIVMVAESDPKQKDILTKIIANLINDR